MKTIEVKVNGLSTKAVENDTLIVPEWFAMKKFVEYAQKSGRKFEGFDNRVFAIIGETEKAYNVVLGGLSVAVATWCPKSLVSVDAEPNANDMTLVCDFATAMEARKAMNEMYA